MQISRSKIAVTVAWVFIAVELSIVCSVNALIIHRARLWKQLPLNMTEEIITTFQPELFFMYTPIV